MASGAATPQNTSAMPSMAREKTSMLPLVAKAPMSVPAAMMATAAIIMFFGPNLRARAPVGRARNIPANVKMDISHEADPTSIENSSMMAGMTDGTLNCPSAIAMPTSTTTIATSTWF